MSDTLSFAEIDGQHVELLPARTVLSLVSACGCDHGSHGGGGGGNAGDGGNGGVGGAALARHCKATTAHSSRARQKSSSQAAE